MTSVNTAKTRSFPGADIGSDHDLVMMSFRLLKEDKNAGPHKDQLTYWTKSTEEGKTRDSKRAEKDRVVNQEIKKSIKNQEQSS